MRGKTKYDLCFDQAYYSMWEMTMGQGGEWKALYRSSKWFFRFVLSELRRQEELTKSGETALARRGLVASESIIKAWVYNVIEDCADSRVPMSPEMLDVIFILFGCSREMPAEGNENSSGKRYQFEQLQKQQTELPTRATARKLGVDPATIHRWKNEPYPGSVGAPDHETFLKIAKLTQVFAFTDRAGKALRR